MAVLSPRAYLAWLGLLAALLFACAVACNVLADPYYLFGTPPLSGAAPAKPAAEHRAQLAKTALLARAPCPRTLVLGNSRPEAGLDPASPAWPAAARPVFNAALAGTGPATMLEMLAALPAACHPRTVIFAADFTDSLLPLYTPAPPSLRGRIASLAQATITLDALRDSLATLLARPGAPGMRPDGFVTGSAYAGFLRLHGHAPLFALKQQEYRAQWAGLLPAAAPPAESLALRQTRMLVRLARARGARVLLFVPPYHARFMALIDELGMAPRYAAWKAALLALARQEGAGLYDFALPGPLTGEPVPQPGDLRPMRFYWELGHFKPALGEHIVAALFADPGMGAPAFGVRLAAPAAPLD